LTGAGGQITTGGATGAGGQITTGGSTSVDASSSSDSSIGAGGSTAAGGSTKTGGTTGAGGSTGTGASTKTGGSSGSGDSSSTGGVRATGGTTSTGGTTGTGGASETGGTIGTGGASETGGTTGYTDAGSDASTDAAVETDDAEVDAAPLTGDTGVPDAGTVNEDASVGTGTLLVVLGAATSGPANVAAWTPDTSWSTYNLNLMVGKAGLAPTSSGGAAMVASKVSTDSENNALYFTTWSSGSGFEPPQALGVLAHSAALADHGTDSMLVYLGTDYQHYWTTVSSGALKSSAPLPGPSYSQAYGPSAAAVVAHGSNAVLAAYVGDDSYIHYLDNTQPGNTWTVSTQLTGSPAVKTTPPALLFNTDIYIFYVRQSDGCICLNRLHLDDWTQTGEELLSNQAIPAQTPSVALDPNGDVIVAWRSSDNGVHMLRGTPGSFGAPVTVDATTEETSAPVVVSGLSGADADIVYTKGGYLQHGRVTGTTVTLEQGTTVSGTGAVFAIALP
jgi:hypothetical protein